MSEDLYNKEHLFLAPHTAKTVQAVDEALQKELFGSGSSLDEQEQIKKLQTYVEKYFYKFDGCRCYEHAKEMDVFIKKTTNDFRVSVLKYFGTHKNQLVSFVTNELKKPLVKFKGAAKSIVCTIFSQRNKRMIAPQEDSKVDFRGRYDNRIKPGDEEYWFVKFEKAGFNIGDFEYMYHDAKNYESLS